MQYTTHLKLLAAALSIAGLSACSGTGGGLVSPTPITPTTPTTPSTPSVRNFGGVAFDLADVTIDGTLNTRVAGGHNNFDAGDYSQGFHDLSYSVAPNAHSMDTYSASGTLRLYTMQYSAIAGLDIDTVTGTGAPYTAGWTSFGRAGETTEYADLPAAGTYSYTGEAFTRTERGAVALDVEFGTDSGSSRAITIGGTITGLASFGTITIAPGSYTYGSNNNIVFPGGSATATEPGITFNSNTHAVRLHGPNANELTGILSNNLSDIYYGASR